MCNYLILIWIKAYIITTESGKFPYRINWSMEEMCFRLILNIPLPDICSETTFIMALHV